MWRYSECAKRHFWRNIFNLLPLIFLSFLLFCYICHLYPITCKIRIYWKKIDKKNTIGTNLGTQGHFGIQSRGAGDRTAGLLISGQPVYNEYKGGGRVKQNQDVHQGEKGLLRKNHKVVFCCYFNTRHDVLI